MSDLDAYMQELKILVQLNLDKAGQFLVEKCQEKINRPNPTGKDPSLPGEPPKRVSGELQGSVGYRKSGDFSVEIFATADHADIEYGTANVAARPFLRPSMDENAEKIADILGGSPS